MRDVHFLFFSHVWVLDVLERVVSPPEGAVFVDASNPSALSWSHEPSERSINNLLRGASLQDSAVDARGISLIPGPPLKASATSVRSALALLSTADGEDAPAYVLLDVHCARELAALMPRAASFRVLWDVADAPTEALADVARLLGSLGVLDRDRWKGFHVYEHPNRVVDDADTRRALFGALVAEHSSLLDPPEADPALAPMVDA